MKIRRGGIRQVFPLFSIYLVDSIHRDWEGKFSDATKPVSTKYYHHDNISRRKREILLLTERGRENFRRKTRVIIEVNWLGRDTRTGGGSGITSRSSWLRQNLRGSRVSSSADDHPWWMEKSAASAYRLPLFNEFCFISSPFSLQLPFPSFSIFLNNPMYRVLN